MPMWMNVIGSIENLKVAVPRKSFLLSRRGISLCVPEFHARPGI